jgi:hypothetical protein
MIWRVILFWLAGAMFALADLPLHSAFVASVASCESTLFDTYNAQSRLLLAALTNGSGSALQTFSYGLNAVGGRTNAVESVGSSVVKSVKAGRDLLT